jgi:hypothetical protein
MFANTCFLAVLILHYVSWEQAIGMYIEHLHLLRLVVTAENCSAAVYMLKWKDGIEIMTSNHMGIFFNRGRNPAQQGMLYVWGEATRKEFLCCTYRYSLSAESSFALEVFQCRQCQATDRV